MSAHRPILCFSHLRWNFVYQRPQHLMSRLQKRAQVFFFEEPVFAETARPDLSLRREPDGLQVVTPVLPHGTPGAQAVAEQKRLLKLFLEERGIDSFVAWYYTPMALEFTAGLQPELTIYDCMDELSAFQGAPPELVALETALFRRADIVFVGGQSLYQIKKQQHQNVHCFPSSIDRAHFATARQPGTDPHDQQSIPRPRIGFFGVLDERLDRNLLAALAEQHPDWNFVLVGPVVKISADELPHLPNIFYVGHKTYMELPRYLSGWDVAMLPFALNASTRFISPTKTPEYLAAGKPVISTPIRDVVEPYGRLGLVHIAATAETFGAAIQTCLDGKAAGWWERVDQLLCQTSWDKTFAAMWSEMMRLMPSPEKFVAEQGKEGARV